MRQEGRQSLGGSCCLAPAQPQPPGCAAEVPEALQSSPWTQQQLQGKREGVIQPKAFPCPILHALSPVAMGQETFKDVVPVSCQPQSPKAGPEGAGWRAFPFPELLPGCH